MISVFHDLLYQPAIYPLLLIARATERVRIGPAALNPSTLHPVELAGQAAALDLASGGRAYLGLVAGAWLDRLGLDERRPVQRMREAVEIVRRLHAGDRSGFAGDLFTLAPGAGLEYEPARRRDPADDRHLEAAHGRARRRGRRRGQDRRLREPGDGAADARVDRERRGRDRRSARSRSWTRTETRRAHVPPTRSGCTSRSSAASIRHSAPGRRRSRSSCWPGRRTRSPRRHERLLDAGVKRVEFGTPQGLSTARGVELLCDRVLPLVRASG